MISEPIEIELDRPRKLKLTTRALMRAESEINRRRGAQVQERVSIDFLLFKAARDQLTGSGSFPLDLLAVLLWAGLQAEEPDPKLTPDGVLDLVDASPLSRGALVTAVWEHYNEVTKKPRSDSAPAEDGGGEDDSPLAERPGSTTGPLQ